MVNPVLLHFWFSPIFYNNNISTLTTRSTDNYFKSDDNKILYGDPIEWGNISRVCADGKRQSPINIIPDQVNIKKQKCPTLKYINYNAEPDSIRINNTGTYVALYGTWNNNLQPRVLLQNHLTHEEYLFYHFHLHWSQNDFQGTEHKIGGESLAAEAHVVHVNRKYGTLQNATNYSDGILVIAFHYKVVHYSETEIGLGPICDYLPRLKKPRNSVLVDELFTLKDLGLKYKREYFFYSGSLTTPPCSEAVKWVVSTKPILITQYEIQLLRNVRLDRDSKHNIRPLQKLNKRNVDFMSC